MAITNQLGIRNSNTIIPLTATTKETKWLSVTDPTHITLTGTGITTSAITRAVVKAYADSLGNWHLRFNMHVVRATGSGARTTATVTFASTYAVVFKNTTNFYQTVTAATGNYACMAYANYNAGTVTINHTSGDESAYDVFGDVELNAEPTWAAANMEGVVAVDVFIPSAAAGIQGLVDNTSGNTGGTPILGKTDGVAVAAGYVGQIITAPLSNGTLSVSDSVYAVSSINLTVGNWLVYCKAKITPAGTATLYRDVSLTTSTTTMDDTTLVRDSGNGSISSYISTAPYPINISTATTLYLLVVANFTGTAPVFTASGSQLFAVRQP